MKTMHMLVLAGLSLTVPVNTQAQVAGSSILGMSVAELREVTFGWSAKRQILGQSVYNDNNERVGFVDDVIVSGDKSITYAIVNAGGFLAVAKHDVAVPVTKFTLVDNKLVLHGATKEALMASPPFEYAN
jgi:sporulation protein YlmC with PRC-barrel domain